METTKELSPQMQIRLLEGIIGSLQADPERPTVSGFDIGIRVEQLHTVGGDFCWSYDQLVDRMKIAGESFDRGDSDRVARAISSYDFGGLVIGDAPGHGLTAGISKVAIYHSLRGLFRREFREKQEITPQLFLDLNDDYLASPATDSYSVVKRQVRKINTSLPATVQCLEIYPAGLKSQHPCVRGLSAGHPGPSVLNYNNGTIEPTKLPSSYPIGILPSNEVEQYHVFQLDLPNSKQGVLFYSDGFQSAFRGEGKTKELFFPDRAQEIWRQHRDATAQEIADAYIRELTENGWNRFDDITVGVIKRID